MNVKLREMKVNLIETGFFKADGGAMFSVVPKMLWEKRYAVGEDNLCPCALRSLLIRYENRTILVDCGIGTKHDEKYLSFHHLFGEDTLERSLLKYSVKLEDVTDVILTHLHFDHCGGATYYDEEGRGVPTFPNAKYWVSPEQWANYLNPNIREADSYFPDNMLPIYEAGLLHFITKETEIIPNLSFFVANGHTPGLLLPIVKTTNKTYAFTGDLIPNTANINLKWLASYDIEPLKSLQDKMKFFVQAVEKEYTLLFQHDYYTQCATIQRTERGIKLKDSFFFAELTEE